MERNIQWAKQATPLGKRNWTKVQNKRHDSIIQWAKQAHISKGSVEREFKIKQMTTQVKHITIRFAYGMTRICK